MIQILFVLLLLVSNTLSDSCVTNSFEEDYDVLFISGTGFCAGLPGWNIGRYEDTTLTDYNEHSNTFIYPQERLSCVTSFMFPVTPGGVIEVNIFMDTAVINDNIQVMAIEHVPSGNDAFLGQAINTPAQPATYVAGWHTISMTVIGNNADMTGYIVIMGMASTYSTVLIDSVRYIPPGVDDTECEIYEAEPEGTTEITTEYTTEVITESVTQTTTEIATETNTTTESSTAATELSTEDVTKSTTEIAVISTDTNTDGIQTDLPTTLPVSEDDDAPFWTPLVIAVFVSILLIIVVSSCICWHTCCRRKPRVTVIVKRT